ncbi:LytTR family transcriptional regulator [Fibrisoma montanum]|uniref:LytTR family transcriptional regulator n=1 Tax=Fibrisoma montanum TaxID=2305895 RepID=A0A418MI86_9BACT|nr:LytTR family DNA-binding domain-containing protein [Fibrisoma montanum]RIV27140.1 LytTR family transcriptional regulator [Fibrisoma montanum]
MFTQQAPIPSSLHIPGYRHLRNAQPIERLEATGNYTFIFFRGNPKPILTSQTLKYFEDQLTDYIRVSKSALINPDFIEKVIRYDAKTVCVQLIGGHQVALSRRRIIEVMERIQCLPHIKPSVFVHSKAH